MSIHITKGKSDATETIQHSNRARNEKTEKERVLVSLWMKTAVFGDIHQLFKKVLKENGFIQAGKIMKLWDCIHFEMKRIFKNAYTFEDGYQLRNDIAQFNVKLKRDDSVLVRLCTKYGLNLLILSINQNFNHIKFGNRNIKTIQLLHLGYTYFIPLLKTCGDDRYVLSQRDEEILEEIQSTLTKPKNKLNEKIEEEANLIKRLTEMVQGYEHEQELTDIRRKNTKKMAYYDVYTPDVLAKNKELKLCTLRIKNAHVATATIIDKKGKKDQDISILNRKNCGYNAFDGDTVYVEINDPKNNTGRVLGVYSSHHKPINSIYMCKVCRDQGSLMAPLDGSFPKIHVDNEPGRRQFEKTKTKSTFSKAQKSYEMQRRESSQYADNMYVTIFNMKFNKETKRAEFKSPRVVPFDPETCDKLFLVLYEYWDISFIYPNGKVVGMINTYDSFQDSLHLIMPLCNIEPPVINKPYKKEIKEIKKKVESVKNVPGDVIPKDAIVFTIDNVHTQDMDDALSYHVNEDSIVVGVHITNITKYISVNREIYKQAQRRFATAYIPKVLDTEPVYLIERSLSTDFLSLVPNAIRAVISVVFHFQKEPPYEIVDVTFSESFIKSRYKLNYKQVERWILDEEQPDDESLYVAIKGCYRIAKELRTKRIPNSFFVRQSDCSGPKFQFEDSFNAQFLIEEFMLLANEHVAMKIYERLPNMSLLRVQDPVADFADWEERLMKLSNANFLSSLDEYCNLLKMERVSNNNQDLIVSSQYYNDFVKYLATDVNRARNMLQYDEYINDFYVHMTEWYEISSSARYVCSIEDSVDNRHFSLNKDLYTHFTSPIRRFPDVIVHLLLRSIINPAVTNDFITERKVDEVCTIANRRLKCNRMFEKRCAPYAIFNSSEPVYNYVLDCTCSNITNEEIHFIHPSLYRTSAKTTIKFSNLCLNQSPTDIKGSKSLTFCNLHWKKIIYSTSKVYNQEPVGAFSIDSHLYDAKLPATKAELFAGIRCSFDLAVDLQEQMIELRDSFKRSHRLDAIISSDSLANPIIEVHLRLSVKSTIRIQFCCHKYNGLKRVTPELLIIHPSLQLCLIHQEDPVICFVPGGTLSIKNNIIWKFTDIKEYDEYFNPLIQLESLKGLMREKGEHTFVNVKIRWMQAETKITNKVETFGIITYDEEMCEARHVDFGEENEEIETFFDGIVEEGLESVTGDLLCIRGKMKQGDNYWVGHGAIVVVRKLQEKEGEHVNKILVFLLTQSDFDIFDDENMTFFVEMYQRQISSRRQLAAVAAVHKNKFLRQIVFGKDIPNEEGTNKQFMELVLAKLKSLNVPAPNHQQKVAIRKSLNEKFSLIWGPPGTGKTSIGCVLAYCYHLKNEGEGVVLYCGPSNESVNIILAAMTEKFQGNCPKMLRIFSKKQELIDFPLPGHFTNCKPLPEELKKYSLHFLIRNMPDEDGDKLRYYDALFGKILSSRQNVRTDVIDGQTVHKHIYAYKVLVKKLKKEFIRSNYHDMILVTTSVGGSFVMREFVVRQIIVDEAGMCEEPETLVPIAKAANSVENVVLIGDHKQLRPIIIDDLAAKRGLQISLFERYQQLQPHNVTLLEEQYRMHPSICEFPSQFFYNGRLKAKPSRKWSGLNESDFEGIQEYESWNGIDYTFALPYYQDKLAMSSYSAIEDNKWPGRRGSPYKCFRNQFQTYPERLVFINVIGDEIVQSVSTNTCSENSRANPIEVKVVGYVYNKLLGRMKRCIEPAKHITVLTQYRLQESLILEECQTILKNRGISAEPIVRTVIKSQGSENDYIIFSTVRSLRNKADIIESPTLGWESKYLGFITDHNQVNVALTRARMGLIIIGNKQLLSANKMWKQLLGNLADRGCVVEGERRFL